MKLRLSILYAWFVRLITSVLPNTPTCMRFRGFLYSLMMKECGKDFQVASTVIFNSLVGISVGNHVYIAHYAVIIGLDIKIGNEVLIGPHTVISGGNHTFKNGSYRFGKSSILPVRIQNGAWVGSNCSITAGSTLPAKSILAAGSVLTKIFDEEKSLYAGVPAVLVKNL